jgi:hypothetical protein
MTVGIYLIEFKKPVWGWYVGQSTDIENRFLQHKELFSKGKHTCNLQEAYARCATPVYSILNTCHRDWLDVLESIYYMQFKARCIVRPPYRSMLNTQSIHRDDIPVKYRKYIITPDICSSPKRLQPIVSLI